MAKKKTKKAAKKSKSAGNKKISKRPENKLPALTAILLCDGISTDSNTGKNTLSGVFDKIAVLHGQPHRPFNIYTKLFGGKGSFSLGFEIIGPDGKTTKIGKKNKVKLTPVDIVEGLTSVRGFPIKESGVYKVYVTVNGKQIGNPAILVGIVVNQPEESDES